MAPTRRFEPEAPHSSSSEEEGDSRENDEQEDSESEEEDKTSPPTPPKDKKPSASKKPETSQTPAPAQSSSSDESRSESDSGSDNLVLPSRRADPNIKPISSKPMEETPKTTKRPRSKPSATESATAAKSSAAMKRPIEDKSNREGKDSKKAKKKGLDVQDEVVEEDAAKKAGDDTKKQLFQRLWSEEDEIAVLKGIIEYTTKKGADPVADMNAFHDFIKNKLHIDVSKTQLSDKVRRLKKKYENNASKGKKGNDRTFSKPHEQKAYELSKKIWGVEANSTGIDSTTVNGQEKKNKSQRSSRFATSPTKVDTLSGPEAQGGSTKLEVKQNTSHSLPLQLSRSIGDSSLEESIVKDGLELIEGAKRLELEEKWKQLQMEEVELFLKRVELIQEQTKLVLAAIKSSEQ